MSQKRKHSEQPSAASNPTPFKKHRAFKSNNSHAAPKRKRPQVQQDFEKSTSIHALKSRIRDLKRLLKHVENVEGHKMSAGMRVERERELEACEHELEEKVESSKEAEYKSKMIGKYHQVRFFDRQRATRIIKRLKKELLTEEDKTKKAELEQRARNANIDLNYAIYYPLLKPYSSLYPKSRPGTTADADAGEDQDDFKDGNAREMDGPKGNVVMWRAVEKATEEGTLEILRYSKNSVPTARPKKEDRKRSLKNKGSNKSGEASAPRIADDARTHAARAKDEDSDGGFFGDD